MPPHLYLWTKVLHPLPHHLLLRNICSPCLGRLPNFSCPIPFMGLTCFLSPLSSLFNYLLYLFSLKWALQELQDNQDFVFAEFVTTDTIYWLQPFLVQSHCCMHAPISIATMADTNSTHSRSTSWQGRRCTPPVAWIPHTHHDNISLPVTTPVVVCIPTPIPPTSITHYISPLITRFNPCAGCGSTDGHLPGCTA